MSSVSLARPARPYPGLRPFEAEEWSIFFGRERMIDEVIERLAQNGLVLIHGASGSGKSSLVRAGVMPKLARQYQRHGEPWLTCAMRPSGGPLWNLAVAFAGLEGRGDDIERIGAIAGAFGARDVTLASVAASLANCRGKSLCLLVDQFEEVFRFEKETSREEAELFVDLIGRAATIEATEGVDLHVVVTMRSEFLGECARFAGLAETINRTQYLVPRMDDEALPRAVRRPAQMYGGSVSEELADRLIASVRGREDELPLLQHGLMLMWDEAVRKAPADGKPELDGAMVEAAGGLAELLSQHADAVMQGAAPDARRAGIVEGVFRALTDVNAEGSAIRRPQSFRALRAVTGATTEELLPILDAFRAPGVSFLTPYAQAPIVETSRIDISHEALIRCWRRVSSGEDGWLKREFDEGLAWRSLLVEARGFEADKRRVLSPGSTEDRGGLYATRNAAWSDRYGGGWERVGALLAASRAEAEVQREARENEQARKLADARRLAWRTGTLAFILILFALLASGFAYYAQKESIASEQSSKVAVEQKIEALHNEVAALNALSKVALNIDPVDPVRSLKLALAAWPRSEIDQLPKNPETLSALDNALIKLRSQTDEKLQSIATFMGHSGTVTGTSFAPDDLHALTSSVDKTVRLWNLKSGKQTQAFVGHEDAVWSAVFSSDGARIVSASQDETARVWDVDSGRQLAVLQGHKASVEFAAFSPDGSRIVTASKDNTARIWDSGSGKQVLEFDGHTDAVTSAVYSPDGKRILTASADKTARVWDAISGKQIMILRGHGDVLRNPLILFLTR